MVLKQRQIGGACVVTLHRPERQNAINLELLDRLHEALSEAARQPECRVLVIEGMPGVFCTGSDLTDPSARAEDVERGARRYFDLLRQLTEIPKPVVAAVDGTAQAGGIGLVAAADIVIATAASTFRLPEILLGMIPACVLPFLSRRIGAQAAFRLALTAQELTAGEAATLQLADQVVEDLPNALRRIILRLERLPLEAVASLKTYRNQLAPLPAGADQLAVAHLNGLLVSGGPRERVGQFVNQGLWQEAAS